MASREPEPISDLHASHIRKIRVAFLLEGLKLDPHGVSNTLNITPTRFATKGDDRRNARGDVIGVHEHGWWQLSSEDTVPSKDVNDHFSYLLQQLLPHREVILAFARGGDTYFDVLWELTYLYAGTGLLWTPRAFLGPQLSGPAWPSISTKSTRTPSNMASQRTPASPAPSILAASWRSTKCFSGPVGAGRRG